MKDKITFYMRCEFCNRMTEYLLRDNNTNQELTDREIDLFISVKDENHNVFKVCNHCELLSLQTRVAWSGANDALNEL